MSVPKTIHDTDTVLFQNLPCLRSRLICDEKEGSVRTRIGFVDELPSRSGIRSPLDFDRHASAGAREADRGVRRPIRPARFGDHRQSRDSPQNTESLCLERTFKFH
jgi:hypothetical protein